MHGLAEDVKPFSSPVQDFWKLKEKLRDRLGDLLNGIVGWSVKPCNYNGYRIQKDNGSEEGKWLQLTLGKAVATNSFRVRSEQLRNPAKQYQSMGEIWDISVGGSLAYVQNALLRNLNACLSRSQLRDQVSEHYTNYFSYSYSKGFTGTYSVP